MYVSEMYVSMKSQIPDDVVLQERDSGGLTVVDYSASWCGPCRAMKPVLETLAQVRRKQLPSCRVAFPSPRLHMWSILAAAVPRAPWAAALPCQLPGPVL